MNKAAAKAKGAKRVCIPNRSSKSARRKREQKKRWFRNGQRWRTGCEGRISVSRRRHVPTVASIEVSEVDIDQVGGRHAEADPAAPIVLQRTPSASLGVVHCVASDRSRVTSRLGFCAGKLLGFAIARSH
jgi:hypothetical protein